MNQVQWSRCWISTSLNIYQKSEMQGSWLAFRIHSVFLKKSHISLNNNILKALNDWWRLRKCVHLLTWIYARQCLRFNFILFSAKKLPCKQFFPFIFPSYIFPLLNPFCSSIISNLSENFVLRKNMKVKKCVVKLITNNEIEPLCLLQ